MCPARFGVLYCSVVVGCTTTLRCVEVCCVVLRCVVSVTLHSVDQWQHYVCCIGSGVTRCTLSMVLYLCCMSYCGLHTVFSLQNRYHYEPPRCRTSHRRTFILLVALLWNDLGSTSWSWSICLGLGLVKPASPAPLNTGSKIVIQRHIMVFDWQVS